MGRARRLLIAALALAGGAGCASIVPLDAIVPVPASDARARLQAEGGRPIDTGAIDFPLLAAAVCAESNYQRGRHQRAPLDYMPQLEAVSTVHAKDMVQHGFFDHVNPVDPLKRTVADRLALVDLRISFYAENIAKTFALQIDLRSDQPDPYRTTVYPLDAPGQFSLTPYGPPIPPHTYHSFARDLVKSWLDSPTHRRNLLTRKARYLGCGCAHEVDGAGISMLYCAQVFYAN